MPRIAFAALAVLVLSASSPAAATGDSAWRSLDGSGNNLKRPAWGQVGVPYLRVARPSYTDGVGGMVAGPPARYVSNRIFNDVGQNLFSENGVSQWGWAWGQFLDHDFGLRDETPAESVPIPFDSEDSLERFANDFGRIDFARTPAAPGTGLTSPRQQLNTISSYIDASNVYGGSRERLEWLRAGPLDGDTADNDAALLLTPDGYLPRVGARGDAAAAPSMDLIGRLMGRPADAVVAGDVRANENIALTAIHTLFAREHNRIVATLPAPLSEETKFQIARRVVGAEIQYITYAEFLPAMGVALDRYHGYDPTVNATLSNEFAVVGYRAHSMIHGEFDVPAEAGTYSQEQLDAFRAGGIAVGENGDELEVTVPLNIAFGNPGLVDEIGLGPLLSSLGAERQYKNDEQIDNSLRSVLFQVPKPGTSDPSTCGAPVVDPACFSGVQDLGAIDIQRGRDHGMPSYNELRRAYGLAPKESFTAITGESTSDSAEANDVHALNFVELRDAEGNVIPLESDEAEEEAVVGIRRTSLAARLEAIYGTVDRLDAFVGMLADEHVGGSELGELQLAIWKRQFQALRDGDRFFHANDPLLRTIRRQFGIDYRRTLAQVIAANTGVAGQADVFHVDAPEAAADVQADPKPRCRHDRRGRSRSQRTLSRFSADGQI